MTYQLPGFYEQPAGRLIPAWAKSIYNTVNWERDLSATFDGLGRPGRKVESLTLEDIVAVKGEGAFVKDGPLHKSFLHLLCRFLHSIGVLKAYPALMGYASSPELEIDDCVDRMMTEMTRFPSADSLGGLKNFNVEGLRSIFPTVVRELFFISTLRPTYIDRLRRKLGSIAYRIATGGPIDQAERSFFVAFSDPFETAGWTREEQSLGAYEKSGLPIAVLETGDPLVGETWELFKRVTEKGPFLDFLVMESNMSFENLLYAYGPQQKMLTYQTGYGIGFGAFVEMRITDALFVLPWQPQDQIVAARERNAQYAEKEIGAAMHNPVLAMYPGKRPMAPRFDLPEVQMRVRLNGTNIAVTEYSYWSPWRERVISSKLAANPQTLLTDLALSRERAGAGRFSPVGYDSFSLLDLEGSKAALGDQAPWTPPKDDGLEEKIVVPVGGGQIKVEPVKMRDFYARMGSTMFPPAFREFAMAPQAWLHVQDQEAEEFIASRLGLTWEQKLQAQRTIRISHNWAKLSRLLSLAQLPLSFSQMVSMCKAISGA